MVIEICKECCYSFTEGLPERECCMAKTCLGRLLVVDDDTEVLTPLCEILSEIGFEAVGFGSSRGAIEALKGQTFDLFLADLVMPDMDGIELLKKALEIDPNLVCIIITGHGTIQTAVEAMKLGAFDYVLKPIEFKVLKPILYRAIEVRRLRMENVQLRESVKIYELSRALQESEKKYQALIENASDAIFIVDMEGYLLEANTKAEELTGYQKNELSQMHYTQLHPVEFVGKVEAVFRKGLNKGSSSYVEMPLMRKDGSIIPVDLAGTFIDYAGKKLGQAVVRDITERKKAEDDLRLFKNLINQANDTIFVIDPVTGRFLDMNTKACNNLGYDREELLKMTVLDIDDIAIPDTFSWKVHVDKVKNEGHVFLEGRHKRKDGTTYPVEVNVKYVSFEKSAYMVAVVRDITERKNAEVMFRNYQKKLRLLSSELSLIEERERRRIAADLHDHIGQILAVSKMKLGALRESASSCPGDLIGHLDEISNLIDQTIKYTRSLTFELSPPILYELGFEAALQWLGEETQEKHNIEVKVQNDGNSKPMSDETSIILYKAVQELLMNIVKHAQAHKATVSIRRVGDTVRISVEDDGVGFDVSETEPYGKFIGAGFGLFNIHERLQGIDGLLEIEPGTSHGTRVVIVAPLKKQ